MLVIPAIDLRGGHCVRLRQGRYEDETIYFEDPVKMAKLWRVQNARTLHLVDLDAARRRHASGAPDAAGPADTTGTPPGGDGAHADNRAVIHAIAEALDVPIQVGGGVRTMEDVEALLGAGVYRVVLGTAAVRDPDLVEAAVKRFTCSRVVVGLDARDGEVRIEGWESGSGHDAVALAQEMERRGVRRFVYTDISRDGMLEGPNIEAYRELAGALGKARITASGGVSGYLDLLRLRELEPLGVDSVIIGRALYENQFPCQQFWCWHEKAGVDLECYSTAPLAQPDVEEACE